MVSIAVACDVIKNESPGEYRDRRRTSNLDPDMRKCPIIDVVIFYVNQLRPAQFSSDDNYFSRAHSEINGVTQISRSVSGVSCVVVEGERRTTDAGEQRIQ